MGGRLFAIPDIHGRLDLLRPLVERLNLIGSDKLVFLGDYVDRGPNASGVIAFIRDLQLRFADQVVCLAGNHEWLMIDGVSQGPRSNAFHLWMVNGSAATIRSYRGDSEQIAIDAKWLARLPLFHEEPGFFFSHAPIEAEASVPYSREVLTWGYWELHQEGYSEKHHPGRVGVCGHIHRLQDDIMEPRFYEHYMYLDCGCGCLESAPLVAVEVNSRAVIYQQ